MENMVKLRIASTFAAASVAGVIAAVSVANAGGFALREQSAYGQGWSFAGSAAGGPGVSGMFWNPALVTNSLAKITVDSSYTLIAPIVELEGFGSYPNIIPPVPTFGESGDIGQDAFVPATSGSLRLTDDVYLGLTINGPFGLTTKPNVDWVGSYDSYSSRIFSLNATPTLGWRVNDWLSLGVGVQFQYIKADLKNRLPGIGANPLLDIDVSDDVGFGFTAGVQLKPYEGTEIGIGFRSSIHHELEGDVTRSVVGPATGALETTLNTPEVVTLGIRQRVGEAFTVAGTVEWTNWSRLGTLVGSGPGAALIPGGALPFEYEDSWFFSVGGEYQFSPAMAFRAGIGYEVSPITDEDRSTRLPDADRLWLSAGGTYNWSEKLSFDLGYSFLLAVGDTDINRTALIPGLGTRTLFAGDAEATTHIVSVGLRYKFGNPAAVVPVVAKY
jgi:long-chain fatty acid transport protein